MTEPEEAGSSHWYTDRKFTISITAFLLILPLSIPKEIGFQKYARWVGEPCGAGGCSGESGLQYLLSSLGEEKSRDHPGWRGWDGPGCAGGGMELEMLGGDPQTSSELGGRMLTACCPFLQLSECDWHVVRHCSHHHQVHLA